MLNILIGSLESFPQRLELCYAAFPESMHNWRPRSWEGIPSERLTAIEQICHVLDVERDGYHVRIQRVLEEERPVLPDIPGEQLAVDRRYAAENATDVLHGFRLARAATLSMISGLTQPQWQRVAIFEGAPTTLQGLINFLCSHDNQHLAGLHWLLGKMAGIQQD